MRTRVLLLIATAVLLFPHHAAAQLDNPAWGLAGGFTPLWQVPTELISGLFDAQIVDLHGHELRVGVVRGTTLGGEWGVSLIHKRFKKDSEIELSSGRGRALFVTEDAEMLGMEVNRFFVPWTIARRAQLGINVGIGFAQMRGFAEGQYFAPTAGAAPQRTVVRTSELFEFVGREIRWMGIGKAELGVATLVGERLKVRVSGGLNFPGYQVASVSISYLMGHDR